ncbi:unnamed protein product [Miscanthus lutarioriparius]|uniref:Cell division cycle protein 123 n=1 Tax=Miscanthus lutarioriparius TaxID=422564 RepID=A0A811NTN9_9POAL|nr:unnamed protein product [Miscanthus lutarioriparius]
MLLEELLRCQMHEWYPAFRRHSIRTVIIPLPAAFVRYLVGQPAYPDLDADADADADTDDEPLPFLLPAITSGRQPFAPIHAHHPDPVSLNSDFFFGSSNDDVFDPDADHPLRPEFSELEAAIDAAIAELGGAALPKLNWSAPKDATFMSADGTTQCTCFAEVAMLLRSSDCVAHDLASARQSCEDFVRPEGARRNAQKVSAGAEEVARPNADETHGSEGTNGVPSNSSKIGEEGGKTNDEDSDVEAATEEHGRLKLIDFNPWGGYTLPLLFTWEELEEEGRGPELEFRVVMQQGAVRPGLMTAVPYDMLDWGEGSGWDVFLKKADEELDRQMNSLDDDS